MSSAGRLPGVLYRYDHDLYRYHHDWGERLARAAESEVDPHE